MSSVSAIAFFITGVGYQASAKHSGDHNLSDSYP